MTHLVFVAPLPPPMHGAARSSANVLARLEDGAEAHGHDIAAIRTSGGGFDTRSPRYHLSRVAGYLKAAGALVRGRRQPGRALYMCAAAGYGIAYDILLALMGRLLGYRLFLHHRSFRYIDRPSRLMAMETRTGGSRMTHVFLCDTQARLFLARYPAARKHLLVSNAFYNPPAPPPENRQPRAPLRIGLLSNLCAEKGLDDFLALLEKGLAQGLPLSGILAGPPFTPKARETLEQALTRFGDRLSWTGPVSGTEKERFFEDIDVFLFPTRYANEAQPIVVFEALARGIPVIAFDRGCIPSDVDGNCGLVVAGGEDFATHALPMLARMTGNPDDWKTLSRNGIRYMSDAYGRAQAQFAAMAAAILGETGETPE